MSDPLEFPSPPAVSDTSPGAAPRRCGFCLAPLAPAATARGALWDYDGRCRVT